MVRPTLGRTGWLAATAVAALGASGLAIAQHGHAGGHQRPETWRGPNITTVNTQRYVETATYPTYYPILPRTMSDGTVRAEDEPMVTQPGPSAPGGPTPGPGAPPTGPAPGTPTPPVVKPPVVMVEPARRDFTAVWSNFWEANRERILATVRNRPAPRTGLSGPLWKDRTVQTLMRGLADHNSIVAGFAAAGLGGARRPEFFKLLAKAAAEREQQGEYHIARSGAILGLGLCGDPQAGHILSEIVAASDPKTLEVDKDGDGKPEAVPADTLNSARWRSAFALLAIGLSGEPHRVQYLGDIVLRHDVPVLLRSSAVLGLGEIPIREATELLVQFALNPDLPHVVRGMAALAVARHGDEPLPGPFARPVTRAEWMLDLIQTFGRDSRSIRLGAAMGLWHCARPDDLPLLTKLLATEDDVQTRATLCAVLGWRARGVAAQEATALRALRRNIVLEQPAVIRGFALLGLGLSGIGDGAALCRDRLAKDPDPHVRAAAAIALALLEGPAANEALLDAFVAMRGQEQPVESAYVLEAMGLAGGDEATAILRKRFAEGDNPHERRGAGIGLAHCGDASIVDACIADLESEAQWTPAGAAVILRLYPDPAIRDRVRPMATRHADPGVRELATSILARWLRQPGQNALDSMAADGVVFPRDDDTVLSDLRNWP